MHSALVAFHAGQYEKAREELAVLLNSGEHWPFTLLARMMFEGLGGEVDVDSGLGLLQEAIRRDVTNTGAMLALAELYHEGIRVEKDIPEAVRWLFKARLNGDERAMSVLRHWLCGCNADMLREYLHKVGICTVED